MRALARMKDVLDIVLLQRFRKSLRRLERRILAPDSDPQQLDLLVRRGRIGEQIGVRLFGIAAARSARAENSYPTEQVKVGQRYSLTGCRPWISRRSPALRPGRDAIELFGERY